MSILNVNDMTQEFGDKVVFNNVSFRLLKGEHVGLVGANGEGKTTFMKLITSEILPDAGTIEWNSKVTIGYMDQNVNINNYPTVKEFLKSAFKSLVTLENKLKRNIFGQNVAIDEVVKCIKMSRAGLKDEGKPVASMLFVGPTGVGKTEICRVLSKELGIKLIRFDMSEYGEKHAASKLIGAPPGYVGYEEGGLLTDSVRKNPYSVLLLDEIEKAHPDILSVLLQVMDYATLTDNQGRKADFRNVILIMTSNAGAKEIGKNKVGFGERVVQVEAIKDEVKRFFTPEFRNRLDKIVVFNHIDKEMARNITIKEIDLFKEQLLSKNIILEFDESVINHISNEGVSKEYGAREISRIINSEIKALLIDEILFGRLKDGGKAKVIFNDSKYYIEF